MGPVHDEYLSEYSEVNNDAHRKAANLIGAPAFVWHQAFWHSSTKPDDRTARADLIQEFLKALHAQIGRIPDSQLEPPHPDIVILPNDRVRTITFQFNWHHMKCQIRIENHIEYISMTSIIDASVDLSHGDENIKTQFKRSTIYAMVEDKIETFSKGVAEDPALTAESCVPLHEFVYDKIWNSFFDEVLKVGTYFEVNPALTGAQRIPIGLKFANFKGFITCEKYPDTDAAKKEEEALWHENGEASEGWGLHLKEIQTSFHTVEDGKRGNWHRLGYPCSLWARNLIDSVWPFLSLIGGPDTLSLMKGRTEFTVSRVLDGRMIYATALGPQPAGQKAPLYFYLHSVTQDERQIGRFVDRICQLGTNRLASIIVLPYLDKVSDDLWVVEESISSTRLEIHSLIQYAGGLPKRIIFEQAILDELGRRESAILGLLAKIQDDMSKISIGANGRGNELGASSLEYRLLRSQYYRENFNSLIRGMRLKRLEGYQPYNEFVTRRLGTAFGFLDSLEKRMEHIKEEWRAIDQLYLTTAITILNREIDQQHAQAREVQKDTKRVHEATKELQVWGELALWGALVPYYLIMIVEHLSNCNDKNWCDVSPLFFEVPHSILHGQIWAIIMFGGGIVFTIFRLWINIRKK